MPRNRVLHMGRMQASFTPPQQSSASAAPIFVGPTMQAPLPSQQRLAPNMTAVVPRSGTAPAAQQWSPPVAMGSGPCTGVICPPGLTCVGGQCQDTSCLGVICPPGQVCKGGQCGTPGVTLSPQGQNASSMMPAFLAPRVDPSMRLPQKPSLTMTSPGGVAPSQTGPAAQTPATPIDNGGGSQTAPPTYTLAPDQGSVDSGLSAGGGTTSVGGPLGPQGNGGVLAGALLGFFVGGPVGGVVGGIAGAFLGGQQSAAPMAVDVNSSGGPSQAPTYNPYGPGWTPAGGASNPASNPGSNGNPN